jgi:regulator of vacuolar morphogenesis
VIKESLKKTVTETSSSIPVENWLSEYRKTEKLLVDIRQQVFKNTSQSNISHAKSLFTQVTVRIDELGQVLANAASKQKLTEAELERRYDLLNEIINDKEAISKSLYRSTSSERESLLKTPLSSSPSSTRRVFGSVPKETEQTKHLNDSGVIQLQKQMIDNQDADLDKLLNVIKRQKEIGIAIGQELGK